MTRKPRKPTKWIEVALICVLVQPVPALAQAAAQTGASGTADKNASELSTSREGLFDDEAGGPAKRGQDGAIAAGGWRGSARGEVARTVASPDHWSKLRARLEVSRTGQLSENVKWKIGARAHYDFVYDFWDFYPSQVKRDQRFDATLRENYLDVNAGAWDLRLGRQHVVWGEMVGLFFADVVSARDLREFLLPDFDVLRIPQWAARAEYFRDDYHAELLWVPVPSYDRIGKPGADFYPFPPVPAGHALVIENEKRPTRKPSNTNYGLRLSALKGGWDLSAFYYRSMDIAPTFYREVISAPVPTALFRPRHDRIRQLGGTLSKDFESFVFKVEVVITKGRKFNVTRLDDANGLASSRTLDYALGMDFGLPADARLNLQFFQRVFARHDEDMISDKRESGASVLLSGTLARNIEAQALLIHSLNRADWMFRPRLDWAFQRNWKLVFGMDIFGGPATGFFGRYDHLDRIYTELRYDF